MSEIIKFIDKYLGVNKNGKNGEIKVEICPFCKGISKKTGTVTKDNLWTFSINIEKEMYNCLRCGAKGHINQLAKQYKEKPLTKEKAVRSTFNETEFLKSIKDIELIPIKDADKCLEYFESRKISEETLTQFGCKARKDNQNLIIPYYRNGRLVNTKERLIKPTDRFKSLANANGFSCLIGMHRCVDDKPLVIIEGEIDMLSVIEAGYNNVVSVPNGCQSIDWIDTDIDFLEKFSKIVLWFDNDDAGKNSANKIRNKLFEMELYEVSTSFKDANDLLIADGKEEVLRAIENASLCPIEGVINVGSIERKTILDIPRFKSGFMSLDRMIRGFRQGELTVFSGKSEAGKSTILGQIVLSAIEQNNKVFVFSGELSKNIFKEWICNQANGIEKLQYIRDEEYDTENWQVTDQNFSKISEWVDDKLFLYDNEDSAKADDIIKTMQRIYRRCGVRTFILDNLMTVDMSNSNLYNAQSDFVRKVKNFARGFEAHCILVAHPRKTSEEVQKEDIGGSGDITNLADNVVIITRLKKEEGSGDAKLTIVKARMNSDKGVVFLNYDKKTRRFYSIDNPKEKDFVYAWNREKLPF